MDIDICDNNKVYVLLVSEPSQRSEILNAYNKLTDAGVPLQPELHKCVETNIFGRYVVILQLIAA